MSRRAFTLVELLAVLFLIALLLALSPCGAAGSRRGAAHAVCVAPEANRGGAPFVPRPVPDVSRRTCAVGERARGHFARC